MQIKNETTVGIFVLASIGIFLFMSYKIGFFKFDKLNYAEYTAYLRNATGLMKKADVKIAGVKIGCVESIDLSKNGNHVEAKLLISKKYILNSDAQIAVRQDGLLGTKFIEVSPGGSDKPVIPNGGIISDLDTKQPTFDDLLGSVANIVQSVNDLTNLVKSSLTDNNVIELKKSLIEAKDRMPKFLENVEKTTRKLNDETLDKISKDFELMKDSIEGVSSQLKNEFFPKITKKADEFLFTFRATSESIMNVTDKINNVTNHMGGNGNKNFFPKIVAEPNNPFFNNLATSADKILYCLDRLSNVTIGLDNNYEGYFGGQCNNFKSLFNFWLHPNSYYFFIGGAEFSKEGYVKRKVKILAAGECVNICRIKKNSFALNIQAGGYYKNIIIRGGLFESTPGFAFDYLFPFRRWISWITTFEAYDFTGKNKIDGCKYNPHLKWMNRMYFNPFFYLSFGVDDFVNKDRRYGFFGVGFNFGGTYFRSLI